MKKLPLEFTMTREEYPRVYLQCLNGLLDLTPTETNILLEFTKLNKTLAATTGDRLIVAKNLGYKNVQVLNSRIRRLCEKGILIPNPQINGTYTYAPIIRAMFDDVVELDFHFKINAV